MSRDDSSRAPGIKPGVPRFTVQARLPDGRLFDAPPRRRDRRHPHRGSAIWPDRRRRGRRSPDACASCTRRADVGCAVTLADGDGTRIYRRSLALLLVTAAADLFPDASVFIEHSAHARRVLLPRRAAAPNFSRDELTRIEQRMRELVQADAPMTKVR